MTRTICSTLLLGLLLVTGSLQAQPGDTSTTPGLPPASPAHLPRWRGFNLTDKFHRDGRNGPFQEDDFRLIHELGFNFVRLPMDYRVWIEGDDWNQFNEASLKEIDEAVNWGAKYGIHVCVNFHRAPGYTVASPPEKTSLWTDAETQRVCAKHWALFARRYRGIPNERLSFNLFNEPASVDSSVYVQVVRKILAAIRAEDPDRLIISDGLGYGTGANSRVGGSADCSSHTRLHADGCHALHGQLDRRRGSISTARLATSVRERDAVRAHQGGSSTSSRKAL